MIYYDFLYICILVKSWGRLDLERFVRVLLPEIQMRREIDFVVVLLRLRITNPLIFGYKILDFERVIKNQYEATNITGH